MGIDGIVNLMRRSFWLYDQDLSFNALSLSLFICAFDILIPLNRLDEFSL